MRANCLIFAVARYWAQGGYLVLRRSRFGWWPHVLWSADLVTFEEFVPTRVEMLRRRKLPPVVFQGRVKTWTAPEGA